MKHPAHTHTHTHTHSPAIHASVLGWPAWQRVLVVSPIVLLLWLAVAWAST